MTGVQVYLGFVELFGVPAEGDQGIRETAEDWVEVDQCRCTGTDYFRKLLKPL